MVERPSCTSLVNDYSVMSILRDYCLCWTFNDSELALQHLFRRPGAGGGRVVGWRDGAG